ncbi:MAG: diguanylate cyclase, partial [Chloroflexota bacterium]|nr:diguanylate cyclase [Chloroflexota bacterium]
MLRFGAVLPSLRMRKMRLPTVSFRVQSVLVVAFAVLSVSTLLIAIQAESVRQQVLAERAAGIQRVATSVQELANYAAASGGRAYQQANMQRRLPDMALQIGADELLITDSAGRLFAGTDVLQAGPLDPFAAAEVLKLGTPVTRPESADTLVYALPFRLAGDEPGVLETRVYLQPVLDAIGAATTSSIVPSVIVLLLAAPLAAFVSNRVLARTYEREQQLRVESRFGSLVRNSSDLIFIVSVDGRVGYVSPSVSRVLGFEQVDVQGRRLSDFIHLDDLLPAASFLEAASGSAGPPVRVEWRIRHLDGSWRDFELLCANLLTDPSVGGLVLNARDVSERKALESQLAHQAFHDPLTNLANRALFRDRIDQALTRASRNGEGISVLFLDLDDFKTVNDSLGHQAGDELLIAIAKRLSAAVRATDTVARLGGDEFAILLEKADDAALSQTTERISDALRTPFSVEGRPVFVTTSIGIAPTTAGLQTSHELLRGADVAMYAAKNRGKGHAQVFERGMHQAMVSRLALDSDLRRAIELEELRVHYQPMVRLAGQEVVGVEALIRWQHPERGLIVPDLFIQLAEDTGLIHQLGRYVLERATTQAREWHLAHRRNPPLSISVNLSAREIQHPDIVELVSGVLAGSGLHPGALVLEITESALMHDTEASLRRLLELKELGVRLAIDDFGTG